MRVKDIRDWHIEQQRTEETTLKLELSKRKVVVSGTIYRCFCTVTYYSK